MADPPHAIPLEAKQHEVGIVQDARLTRRSRNQTPAIVATDEPQAGPDARLLDLPVDFGGERGEETLVSRTNPVASGHGGFTWGHQHSVRRIVGQDALDVAQVVGGHDPHRHGADLPNANGIRAALLCWRCGARVPR
jgi:hypothetical protein